MFAKMAIKNIFRQKRRSIFTSIGMIFGAVLVSFSVSLTDGTYQTLIGTFTRNQSGHIQVHKKGYLESPSIYKSIKQTSAVEQILSKEKRIRSFSPRVYTEGLAFFNKKSTGVSIKGISSEFEKKVTGLNRRWDLKDDFLDDSERSVIISKYLSKLLQIDRGSQIIIISQGADGSIANDMFEVKGVVDEKRHGLSPRELYMPIGTLQEYLSMGSSVHEYAVLLENIEDSRRVSMDLNTKLEDVTKARSEPWQVILKDFYKAMLMDKQGTTVSLGIIIFIVALHVFLQKYKYHQGYL